jgi:hypothetical protein
MNNKASPQTMAALQDNRSSMKSQMWRMATYRLINGRISFWCQILLLPTILSGLVMKPATGWGRLLAWVFWLNGMIALRALYNFVLYPAYFTPLYSIPTPKVSSPFFFLMPAASSLFDCWPATS